MSTECDVEIHVGDVVEISLASFALNNYMLVTKVTEEKIAGYRIERARVVGEEGRSYVWRDYTWIPRNSVSKVWFAPAFGGFDQQQLESIWHGNNPSWTHCQDMTVSEIEKILGHRVRIVKES